nr:type VI secretion system tip protein VgrG [Pasteurella sp.]
NEKITIGNDRVEDVVRDENLTIGRDQTNLVNRNRITKIVKDEVINVGNHRKLDVFADQQITTGGHYQHNVSKKTEWKSGIEIKQKSKTIDIQGYQKVRLASQGGTIIIDGSGITLKGSVTIKGSLAIVGGAPDAIETFSLKANDGSPICEVCEKMKANKK